MRLLTVEGLAGRDGTLHSVQQALVDADATQCGFCTPGFAMAMFAFAHGGEARTTRPFMKRWPAISAAAPAIGRSWKPAASCAPIRRVVRPRVMRAKRTPNIGMLRSSYLAPKTLDDMVEAKAQHPDAILLAGGTDLGLRVSKERETFPAIISTASVSALKTISDRDGKLTIGGGVTYTQALPYLDRHFPSFAALVRRIGSRQIRNLGTFAGNLANASPIGDSIPCLIALDATITLRSKRGERQVKADDFILGYRKTALESDEVIEVDFDSAA